MPKRRPLLPVEQVLAWADAHHKRTGRWPNLHNGPVQGARGETWYNVNAALSNGLRGLPGDDSLARLLARLRGTRPYARLPDLTAEQIIARADAHRERFGEWPRRSTGPAPEPAGTTWQSIHDALRDGGRGLPGGDTLARLLLRERGLRPYSRPALTEARVLAWAKAHRRRFGRWPSSVAGPVADAAGEV